MPNLLMRFARRFVAHFGAVVRESIWDRVILAATIVYLVLHGLVTKRLELVTPVVWGLCALVSFHAFKAAFMVGKEIKKGVSTFVTEQESPIFTPTGKHATVLIERPVAPRFYQLKLYGVALLIFFLCASASFSIWQRDHFVVSASDAKAQLSLQFVPVLDGDTLTHISIRAGDPFTVQITNNGLVTAENLKLLKLMTSDGCEFKTVPSDFLRKGVKREVQNDPAVIYEMRSRRHITETFSVECLKGITSFHVSLQYWCPSCPNDNLWDEVNVFIKSDED
jgi:hypothetical protein